MALAQAVARSYFQSKMVENWFRKKTERCLLQPHIYMLTVAATPDFFIPERLYLHKLVKCQDKGESQATAKIRIRS